MPTRHRRFSIPLISAAIAGTLGTFIGYTVGRDTDTPRRPSPVRSANAPAEQSRPPTAGARNAAQPALPVRLVLGDSRRQRSARGLLVRRDGHRTDELLLPLAALQEATGGHLLAGNHTVALGRVSGVHPAGGLALVETGLDTGLALEPAESAALYLGLELEALTPTATRAARVETAALQRSDGYEIYGVHREAGSQNGFAALVPPGTRTLAGILTGRRLDDGLHEALDVYTLSRIEAARPGGTPMPIAAFSRHFFNETTAGRRFSFYAAVQAGNWRRAIEAGPAVLAANPGDDDVEQTLEQAYLEQIRRALNENRVQAASELLDQARTVLSDTTGLLHARAAVLGTAGRPAEAADVLLQALEEEPGNAAVRRHLRQLLPAAGERGEPERARRLLESAVDHDPAHAPYHIELGNVLYRQRRYAEALSRWNYASQLDPALHDELGPLMDNARRRLSTPGRIVVPLIDNGHSYFVDAAVNGRGRRLLLDTGASFTAISPGLAGELGIDYTSAGRRVRLSTANGLITAPVVKLERVEVNGATVSNIEAVVLEQLNGPGLLGLNFLNRFNIDIDRDNSEMILRR